jgi:tellurite resistance protein
MTSKQIERLRDKLLARGRPSVSPSLKNQGSFSPELAALAELVRPFAEVMYLVLVADSALGERERDVLRGALRSLTEGALSSAALDEMLEQFERKRAQDGWELRLDQLASQLYSDRADARLALGLAVAAAETEAGIGADERAVIVALAERLRVSDAELAALLQEPDQV